MTPAPTTSKLQWAAFWSAPVVSLLFCLDELWRRHPAHHFFPLALGAGAVLVFRQLRGPLPSAPRFSATPWLMGVHLLLALVAFLLDSPVLAGMAVLTAAVSFNVSMWNLHGRQKRDFYLSGLSLFLIPPPLAVDETFRQALAAWATKLSQVWLDDMGMLNLVEGSVVVTAGKRFFVSDACSGINSMLVALCVAVIVCAFQRRSRLHLALLLVSTAVIAVGSNMLRILAVIYGSVMLGLGLDKGLPHEVVGIVSFVLDLLLVWGMDRGLLFILRHGSFAHEGASATSRPAPLSLGVFPAWAGKGSLAVACVGLMFILVPQVIQTAQAGTVAVEDAQKQEFELPARLGEWERQGDKPLENDIIGDMTVRNVVWLYRKGGLEAYVAMNFPFVGVHDTRLCYLGQGWQLEKQQDSAMPGETAPTTRTVDLFHPIEHRNASLRLIVFDQQGRVIPYPVQSATSRRFTDRVLQRWAHSKEPPVTYTLQLLVPSTELDAAATAQVEELLSAARAHVARELATTPQPAP